MKHPYIALFLCMILCASAFPQEKGVTRCDDEMKRVPMVTEPGSAYVVEQLSCDQAVSIIGLEKGYFRIQLGNSIGYVYAKYVRMLESQKPQAPQQIQQQPAKTTTREAPPAAVQRAVMMSDDFPRFEIFAGYSYLRFDTNDIIMPSNGQGGEASLSVNVNEWIAAEFDFSFHLSHYGYRTGSIWSGYNVGESYQDYAFMVGPRFNYKPIFVHVLFGLPGYYYSLRS